MICGGVTGVIAPPAIVTLGVTVTADEPLVSETVKPPAGAGIESVTGNGAGWPGPIVTLAGRPIAPMGAPPLTVTVAAALVIFAALAVIVVAPGAIPVTGTLTLVAPAAKAALAGTVATPGLLETSVTVSPAANGADKLNVRFWTAAPVMVRLAGAKLNVSTT